MKNLIRIFNVVTVGLLFLTSCSIEDVTGDNKEEKPSISVEAGGLLVADSIINVSVAQDSIIVIDYKIDAPNGIQLLKETIDETTKDISNASGQIDYTGQIAVDIPFANKTIVLKLEVTDKQNEVVTQTIIVNIEGPVVVFHSGFEEGNKDIWDDWDGNPDESNLLVEDPGPFDTQGNHVMKLIPPPGERGGADLVKVLPSQHDRLYVRWYIKYENGFNFNALNHGGGLFAGDRNLLGRSDIRPDGTNQVTCTLEYGNRLHTPQIYAYYRGMHQDCADPNGSCWGDVFPCTSDEGQSYCEHEQHRDPPLPPELEADRWYSMEIKLKLGTPSADGSVRDGEISLWVDGINYGKWDDLWMRTTYDLKINILWLSLFHHNGTHADAGVFYDDVVVSTKPIGIEKLKGD